MNSVKHLLKSYISRWRKHSLSPALDGTGERRGEVLLVFIRNPALGKVKTRLAADVGDEKALAIYKKLLTHTRTVAIEACGDVFVFITETLEMEDWNIFKLEQQQGNDLGEKMQAAFATVLTKGYQRAVIIGSDCPTLSAMHIKQAFAQLQTKDIVIGPAKDGGYYLLGMKKLNEHLFQNIQWSTAAVFSATVDCIKKQGLSYEVLEILTDVDEVKDLPDNWRHEFGIPAP